MKRRMKVTVTTIKRTRINAESLVMPGVFVVDQMPTEQPPDILSSGQLLNENSLPTILDPQEFDILNALK